MKKQIFFFQFHKYVELNKNGFLISTMISDIGGHMLCRFILSYLTYKKEQMSQTHKKTEGFSFSFQDIS